MTHAILTYQTKNGNATSLKVRPQQCLLIGSSNSADIKLADPNDVAPQHCEVRFEHGSLEIKDLTKGKRSFQVNGIDVRSSKLVNGDSVAIGNNRLTVAVESPPAEPETAVDDDLLQVGLAATPNGQFPGRSSSSEPHTLERSKMNQPTSAQPVDYREPGITEPDDSKPVFTDCGNGIQTIELTDFKSLVHPLLVERADHWQEAVCLNHTASGLDQPPPDADNLLAEAPPDLKTGNDLYFETSDDMGAVLDRFTTYAEMKSAILVVMAKRDQTVDYPHEFRSLATWFLNPDLLKFNLINGTPLLISKIFQHLDFLVISDPDTRQDLILLNDPSVVDWDTFVSWIKEHRHVAGN